MQLRSVQWSLVNLLQGNNAVKTARNHTKEHCIGFKYLIIRKQASHSNMSSEHIGLVSRPLGELSTPHYGEICAQTSPLTGRLVGRLIVSSFGLHLTELRHRR